MLTRRILRTIDLHLENSLFTSKQSVYRRFHCTETALLRVINDFLCVTGSRKECVLVLLDFSSAFDVIDQ